MGGEHHPIATQSEVRLLVRHDSQCERLRLMVSNVLLYQTLPPPTDDVLCYGEVSSLHSIVSHLIIRIVYMLIRSRVQIHCDSFIHSSRVSKIHHQPCHVVYTDYRPVPLQHYVYPTGAEGLYLVVDEKGKVGLLLLCLLLYYI